MSGMHNSVDRWFLIDGRCLGLSVDGYTSLLGVIEAAVRRRMVADDSPASRQELRDRVNVALRHMDDDVEEIDDDA